MKPVEKGRKGADAMGGRRHRWNQDGELALLCIAFGMGIILSLFVSVKLVMVLAAIFLVVLGLRCSSC